MKTFVNIVVVLLATQLAACNAAPDAGPITKTSSESVNARTRDVHTLEDALVGHWRTDEYDLFYGAGVLWRVENGQPPDKLNYQVVSTDESRSLILLKMSIPTGSHWREIIFSPDKRSFESKFWVKDGEIKLPGWKATYIGSEQSPPAAG